MKIKEQFDRIENRIDRAYNDLKKLQAECAHPNVESKHKADTGNWCPQDDRYWIDYKCPDCDKRWSKDA